jgi:hypothetical protein
MRFITSSDNTDTLAKEVIYFVVKEGIADKPPVPVAQLPQR